MLKLILLSIFIVLCILGLTVVGIYYILKVIFKDFKIDDFDENEQWI